MDSIVYPRSRLFFRSDPEPDSEDTRGPQFRCVRQLGYGGHRRNAVAQSRPMVRPNRLVFGHYGPVGQSSFRCVTFLPLPF
jgi:hypothetical protein